MPAETKIPLSKAEIVAGATSVVAGAAADYAARQAACPPAGGDARAAT